MRIPASLFLMTGLAGLTAHVTAAAILDPLPSWNDTASKHAIVDFVIATTTPTSPKYVPPAERVAVFDNDGTLWAEQPMYFQLAFALDRAKTLAPKHPEWKQREPFASLLRGDTRAVLAGGEHAVLEIAMATHADMTADEFEAAARSWLLKARHPRTGRLYTEMVYQPMLELLGYLRANGFKTFIVSGGGIEFLRVFAEKVYGIPPEQVVGSSIRTKYEIRDGVPAIARLPQIDFIDDKSGKPIAIHKFIGRRPVLAFGNSDGDFEMLEWSTAGGGPRLGLILHHDDAVREWAYDRDSGVGRLARALDEAPKRGWIIVGMKDDWGRIFPYAPASLN